jgi:hypothetical protein
MHVVPGIEPFPIARIFPSACKLIAFKVVDENPLTLNLIYPFEPKLGSGLPVERKRRILKSGRPNTILSSESTQILTKLVLEFNQVLEAKYTRPLVPKLESTLPSALIRVIHTLRLPFELLEVPYRYVFPFVPLTVFNTEEIAVNLSGYKA